MSHFFAKWLKLSLVAIMGCGFLAMMIYAMVNRDEISSSQIEPPLITPPAEPLKRRPDQPGGMQIPNRDKLVFDLLDSSNTRVAGTDVPPVEEVSVTEADINPQAATNTNVAQVADTQPQPATPAPVASEPKPEPAKIAVSLDATPKVEAPLAPKAEPKSETKPEIKAEIKAEPVKQDPKPVAAKGRWGVQLAAVSSAADGKAFAAKIQKQYSALAGLTPNIVAAPGGKAYRVQLLGASSRDEAAQLCASLKGKQGCFPVSQ